MGSFTGKTADFIMGAIFPTTASSNVPVAAGASGITTMQAQTAFRIYNNVAAANELGIYSANNPVKHRIDLIVGSSTTGTAPGGTPITDANFNTAGTALQGNTTAAGTLTFPTYATTTDQYYLYKGTVMGDTTFNSANTWTAWYLGASTSSSLPTASNNSQIAFPQSGGSSAGCKVVGFVISAATANTSSTGLTTSTVISQPTGSHSTFIAYGDLNTFKTVSANDTPIFTGAVGSGSWPTQSITTNGAIVITLD